MFEPSPLRSAVASTTESGSSCPECGQSVRTVGVDEGRCPDCDVVVDSTPVSRDPRPIYDHRDWQTKSRTGGRSTALRSDNGLGTGVEWETRDWETTRTTREYRVDYGLGEIRRMASALELPRPEREEAGRLYRTCHRQDLVQGRSMEGFATACLLAAVRQSGRSPPVLTSEFEAVSRATTAQIRAARGAIACYLEDVTIPPLRPEELAPRVAGDLDAPVSVRRAAGEMIQTYSTGNHAHSLSPRTVVGAAFHAAYDVGGATERPTLSTISEAVDVAPSTISRRKATLLECYEAASTGRESTVSGRRSSN